jgi:hypothetical protein
MTSKVDLMIFQLISEIISRNINQNSFDPILISKVETKVLNWSHIFISRQDLYLGSNSIRPSQW